MNNNQKTIAKIHQSIRFDYLKSEFIVICFEVMFVFFLLQFITIFIPQLQTQIPNTPLRLSYTISASVGLLYAITRMIIKYRAFQIAKVQPKLAELDELYATTMEIESADTLPAQALQSEFIEKAKKTSTYPLMNYSRLFKRMGLIGVILCLLLITPFMSSIQTVDFDWIEDLIPTQRITDIFAEPDNVTLLDDTDIYGNQTNIVGGNANIQISLDLTTGGGDYANPLAWQNDARDTNSRFSGTIDAKLDSPAIEKLPEEFELAKAYNLKIRQIS